MTTNPKHVFKDSDISKQTILVPARMIKMPKPIPGKMDFKILEAKLLKRMTAEELKTKYLGWFLVPTHQYPRAFLRWADGVDAKNVKCKVYQPMQVKLAARFYRALPVDEAEACRDLFKSLGEICWNQDGASNPACISIAVVRKGKKYTAPRYTLGQLTRVVKKNVPRKRKAPTPKKGTMQGQPKSKRSKRRATGNGDALRELQQTQPTLEESIFQIPKGKKKKRSRSSSKKQSQQQQKKLDKKSNKKQRKNGNLAAAASPTKDRWGFLNPQIYTHWKKASFSMRESLGWAARIFKKRKKPVLVVPEAGKPCVAKFTHFISPELMVTRGKGAHAMENPLNFTEHHRWIAEVADLQWTEESKTTTTTTTASAPSSRPVLSSNTIKIPALPTPVAAAAAVVVKDPSFVQSALVRKPTPTSSPPPISLSAVAHEEMEILGFAFHQDSNGGGGGLNNNNNILSSSFSSHMILYADQGDQDTTVVSKYRIKHVKNQGLFRVLVMTREWAIKRQIWNKVLQYDSWCGIEDSIKDLHIGSDDDHEKAAEKLFLCISSHLKTSDPVDLYYEFHDKVLKQLENAMADKSDSVKATVDRARTIFNSLCKIQNPTRDLAASSRGFQGERLKVLMALVHCMIVSKGETQSVDPGSKWQDAAFQTMEEVDEDSMYSGDFNNNTASQEDQGQNEWHRNRFTSATVRIWDSLRQHRDFFSKIQKMIEDRGFKKTKTISDFMAHDGSLGRGRFRFYILNTFNHLFPYGCPEARLDNSGISAKQLQEENQEFQELTHQLTKAFGLSSKAYLGL